MIAPNNTYRCVRALSGRYVFVALVSCAYASVSITTAALASETNSLPAVGAQAAAGDTAGGSKASPKSTLAMVVDDSIITTKIKASLLADGTVNDSAISVETNQGTVVLGGFVNTPAQIEQAQKIAKNIDGVKAVVNKVALRK